MPRSEMPKVAQLPKAANSLRSSDIALKMRHFPKLPARHDSRSKRALLLIGLLVFALAGSGATLAGEAAVTPEPAVSTEGLLNFDGLVHLALRQSPYFTKSALEIEVRRMD